MKFLLAETPLSIPLGFDNWLENFACAVFIIVLVVHLKKSLEPRPPMDRQVRDLEDRLNAKIDKEVDVLGNWVAKDFATKVELQASDRFNAEALKHKMEQINALTQRVENIATTMTAQWEQRMRDLTRKLDDFSIEISNKVGELRGETRRMK